MTQGQLEYWFKALTEALKSFPLPTQSGTARLVSPDEFMFMFVDGNLACFKHRNTRNYLNLNADFSPPRVEVPKKDAPYLRGFFDI